MLRIFCFVASLSDSCLFALSFFGLNLDPLFGFDDLESNAFDSSLSRPPRRNAATAFSKVEEPASMF